MRISNLICVVGGLKSLGKLAFLVKKRGVFKGCFYV